MKSIITALLFSLLITVQAQAGVFDYVSATSIRVTNPFNSTQTIDIKDWYLSIDGNFYQINTLNIQSGSTVLPPNGAGTVVFDGLTIPTDKGSLALWLPGVNTSNPSSTAMYDFVQWGAGGQAHESLAVNEGLWNAGVFISGNMPFTRNTFLLAGDISEWSTSTTTGIETNVKDPIITVGPNPVVDQLMIHTDLPGEKQYQLFDVSGKLLVDKRINNTGTVEVSTTSLLNGVYLLRVTTAEGELITTQKIIK